MEKLNSGKNYRKNKPIQKENINLEYKKSDFKLPKNFWETYSAMANTSGGFIVLGIDEPHTYNYKITGVSVPEDVKRDFFSGLGNKKIISQRLTSDNSENYIEYEINGKIIIQIYVREANHSEKPVYINGIKTNAYVRHNDGDFLMDDEEYRYFITDSNSSLDSGLLDNYNIDDLNEKDINDYRKLLFNNTKKKKYDDFQNYSNLQFLYDIGVFKIDRKNSNREYKLTKDGLLFFGKLKSILDEFPGFQLDYFKYNHDTDNNWVDRVSSGDMNYPELNIFSFYNVVLNKLPSGIPDKFIQNNEMTRGSYYADLKSATKEALVNSLMHPYYNSSKAIRINDYESCFEFFNPGNMRVSLDSFIKGQDSDSRNSVISSLFRKSGIAERAGSGGPRIFESAINNHLLAPDVVILPESTKITIWKVDLLYAIKNIRDLSDEQIKILGDIINYFTTIPQLSKRNPNIPKNRIRTIVKNLTDMDLIVHLGSYKSSRYIMNLNEQQIEMEKQRLIKKLNDTKL
ncbi:putative DNA binding domain-containing protein [Fructilactobacillus hinvesii]|uniref:DNA binding domain-containing protein n=1 Tax=Fructilactobacillus hinvesii TaxID=2940300 RepID=A0ABY5BTB8_9LACO|nr:RNA-binding domain-containing protein [Fructilactobacillus hinvesii]USS88373.1 putative DNA binding domain-containing protein [Fructilactobacillus hinvesii]